MQRAFTLIELVFVMVVTGILAAVFLPKLERDSLYEAALQVVAHIRYTQHLAMVDDKFDPSNSVWYKGRWQIQFAKTVGSGNKWSYMIYSDGDGPVGYTGTPDILEHARNPLSPSKYLSGGYSAGNIDKESDLASKELNIGSKYNVEDVDFKGGCTIAINKQRLFFDHLGRPFYGGAHLQTKPYKDESSVKMLRSTCLIELCKEVCTSATAENKVVIQVEPETGYTHIL